MCAAGGRGQGSPFWGREAGGPCAARWCPLSGARAPRRSSPTPPRHSGYSAAGAKTLSVLSRAPGRSGCWRSGVISACGPVSLGNTKGEGSRRGGCWLLCRTCLAIAKKRCWVCAQELPASDEWFCSAIVCNILLALLLAQVF